MQQDRMSTEDRAELNLTFGDLATNQGADYTIGNLREYADNVKALADSLRTLTFDPDAGIKLQSLKHWTLRLHAATQSLNAQRAYRLMA